MFWVGLIDSAGSIQCNHWRKKSLQYRIVIDMHIDNLSMLKIIENHLGGSVRCSKNNSCVWVVDHQRQIWELFKIFDRYPPLTTRVQSQIAFFKECTQRKDVEWYLQNRDCKYNQRKGFAKQICAKDIKLLQHFPIWLSGFVTGEGCFSVRTASKDKNVTTQATKSFSIGQKHDAYLIKAIRDFFGGVNKVRSLKDNIYLWEVYRRDVLKSIICHCKRFPLLGKKATQLEDFIKDL
nr:intron-encoded endonuclease aI3-2 [Jaagichlorella roystonensis]QHU78359.1 intron-encoded endonuclease aI3-2 [Jaagichlorella roystonensis]